MFLVGFFTAIYTSKPHICKPAGLNDAETVASALSAAVTYHQKQLVISNFQVVFLKQSGPAENFLIPSDDEKALPSFVFDIDGTPLRQCLYEFL